MERRLMLNNDVFTLGTKINKSKKTLIFAKVSTQTSETYQLLRITENIMLSCTHHVEVQHRDPNLVITHKI